MKTAIAFLLAVLAPGCQAIPLIAASVPGNAPDPQRQAQEQQRLLTAALADFPYTPEERSACSSSYQTALMLADYPPQGGTDQATQTREEFKGCVIQRRQQSQEMRARFAAQQEKRAAEDAKKAAEDQKRQEEIEKNAKLDTAAAETADDPGVSQVLLSVLLCSALESRTEQAAAIAKDKKYSQLGGAVDLRRRVELQDQLAETDDSISSIRGSLRERKRPPLPCKDKRVVTANSCLYDESYRTDVCLATYDLMSRAIRLLDPRPTD